MNTIKTKETVKSSEGRILPKMNFKGICATCINAVDCSLSADSNATIYQCEEYEGNEGIYNATHTHPEPTHVEESVEVSVSLCSNCEHRKTCTLHKNESGVWHCEEYL